MTISDSITSQVSYSRIDPSYLLSDYGLQTVLSSLHFQFLSRRSHDNTHSWLMDFASLRDNQHHRVIPRLRREISFYAPSPGQCYNLLRKPLRFPLRRQCFSPHLHSVDTFSDSQAPKRAFLRIKLHSCFLGSPEKETRALHLTVWETHRLTAVSQASQGFTSGHKLTS